MILGRCLLRQTPPIFYFISCTVEVFPRREKKRKQGTEHNQRGGNGSASAVGVGASGVGGISLINRTRIKGPERRGFIGIFGPHIKGVLLQLLQTIKRGFVVNNKATFWTPYKKGHNVPFSIRSQDPTKRACLVRCFP